MPLTYTGRNVLPGNGVHPSLVDIAVGLSRQPRFAGQTRRWWSVLDHTLFGDELIKAETMPDRLERPLRLAWLLHDAHEAITGDVPTPVKGDELRAAQAQLDEAIYGAYHAKLHQDSDENWIRGEVKYTDNRCLHAEAHVAGPPTAVSVFVPPDPQAEAILVTMLQRSRWLGHPPFEKNQANHPAVKQYLERMLELM